MGKGDLRTKKGKRVRGSFGKTRKRNHNPAYVAGESKPEKEVDVKESEAVAEKKETKVAKPKAAKPKAKELKEETELKAEPKAKEEKESKSKKEAAPETDADQTKSTAEVEAQSPEAEAAEENPAE